MALDAASNGNFNTRSAEEAYQLIENLASSNSTKNADFERQKQAGNIDGKQIAELKTKLDSVHNILVNKKSVQFAAEVKTYEPKGEYNEEDVSYIGGSGFQNQRFGNQQGGYGQRSTFTSDQNPSGYVPKPQYNNNNNTFTRNYGSSSYQTPPAQTEQSRMESMFEQLLEGQQKNMVDFNTKFNSLYTDLNGKFESLSTHMKKMEIQIAQTAGALKRQEGILPGRTDTNPKYQCNAINAGLDEFAELEEIEDDFAAGSLVSIDTAGVHRSIQTTSSESAEHEACVSIDTPDASIDTDEKLARDTSKDTRIDRCTPCIDRHGSPPDTPSVEKPKPILERVYRPKRKVPPPPKHLLDPISPKQLLGFQKMVRRIPNALTFEEACEYRPLLSHFRDCRESIEEIEVLFLKARHTPPLKKLKKRADPGIFSVPCSISGVEFKESLVDSGAGVNVMSREIAEGLGVDIHPPKISLTYANNSTSLPHGTIPDLMVTVGDCLVPTDFHVLEMSAQSTTQLILGRPFMATAGAIMDTPGKKISFSYIDKEVYYEAIPTRGTSKHVPCVDVVTGETPVVDNREVPSDEPNTIDALDKPSVITKKEAKTVKAKKKVKNKDVKGTPSMTLIPQKCDGDSIEYKVKCKGASKPFSKVRIIIPPELKEKGMEHVESSLRRTLKMEVSSCRTSLGVSSQSSPD